MMNMFGNLGGVISTALVPILVKHFGWLVALGSGTVTATIAALLWFWVRAGREATDSVARRPEEISFDRVSED
jgi:cyanate permease